MSTIASQTTGVTIAFSTVCSGADQRKHQSSASLAFVRGIYRWPVDSPHKGTVTQKTFLFRGRIARNSTSHLHIEAWTEWQKITDGFFICTKLFLFARNYFASDYNQTVISFLQRNPLKISQYWIRHWRGAEQATSHNQHQWWPSLLMYVCVTRIQRVKMDLMMTSSNGNIFRVTGHLYGEFTGPRWIPRTKASDAELWCFLWFASK